MRSSYRADRVFEKNNVGLYAASERVPRRIRPVSRASSRPSSLLVIVVVVRHRGVAPPRACRGLVVEHLNRRFEDSADGLKLAIDGKGRYKKALKARHKERKREDKARAQGRERASPALFVLDFKGDLRASAAASLREEVSAVLRVAKPGEQVLLRLENSGRHGARARLRGVSAHALEAARLEACSSPSTRSPRAAATSWLASPIGLIAAPFAIVGSIGVLAQLPNFHRLLEEKGVDFEQIMAGRYKRTLTMFGKNTDEGREKLQAGSRRHPRAVQEPDPRAPAAGRRRARRDGRALVRRSCARAQARRRAQDERRLAARGGEGSRPLPHRLQAAAELAGARPRRRREPAHALTIYVEAPTLRRARAQAYSSRHPLTTTTMRMIGVPLRAARGRVAPVHCRAIEPAPTRTQAARASPSAANGRPR